MASKKNKKKIKKVNRYSKGEFLFNIISICLMILLGLFIGYRSLYYYSKQTNKAKKEVNTLAKAVLSNNRVTKLDNGLHQEKDGYVFKGIVDTNYVKFAGRLFRIIKVNNDNSVKVASNISQATLLYGNSSSYKSSNIYNWLNKTDKAHSGVFYNSIPGVEDLLVKTSWCRGELIGDKVECGNESGSDYFTLLTLDDYINTLGKNSYLNFKKNNWILGKGSGNTNLYINQDGSMVSTDNYESFGTTVVFTFKKDIKVLGGSGTLGDPYIIDQENHDNYVSKYVKIGNDLYQVYEDNGDVIRLVLTRYLLDEVGNDLLMSYSEDSSLFNPLNKNNIAYYLNHDLYNLMPYKEKLAECILYTGEVSFSNNLDYTNLYSDEINNKVGLLNSFDLSLSDELNNYYLMNTTSSVGSMAYVAKNDNTLEEVKVEEQKRVVPTICIDKKTFIGGSGTKEDPFVVE